MRCPGRTAGSRWTILLVLALTGSGQLGADERSETETRIKEIGLEISQLQATLEQNRGELSRERSALRELDLDIQSNARSLAEAGTALVAQEAEVQRLEADQAAFLQQLERREDALSRQVLAAWRLGRESRLKLILNQDDPARLGRLLAYYDYLGQAQGEQIRELRDVLVKLDEMRAAIDRELVSLNDIKVRYEKQQATLEAQREERSLLLAQLEQEISGDSARIEELERNRADLETLLQRLDDALADIPSDMGDRKHPAELRGQLPMPTAGRVLQAFGQPRAAGMKWQGWLIGAPAGQAVRSIAYGRVAYADWLRGYGLLLIIDHGDGFMTLYGQNESLSAEVGDWVEPGEVISSVGQGADRRQGLYFELRREGKAVDPAAWIKR